MILYALLGIDPLRRLRAASFLERITEIVRLCSRGLLEAQNLLLNYLFE
jgi:hypothetical protein